jgi:hypothetical protein
VRGFSAGMDLLQPGKSVVDERAALGKRISSATSAVEMAKKRAEAAKWDEQRVDIEGKISEEQNKLKPRSQRIAELEAQREALKAQMNAPLSVDMMNDFAKMAEFRAKSADAAYQIAQIDAQFADKGKTTYGKDATFSADSMAKYNAFVGYGGTMDPLIQIQREQVKELREIKSGIKEVKQAIERPTAEEDVGEFGF